MQIQIRQTRFLGGPNRVTMPGIRTALECGGLPRGFLTLAMQVVAEEGRFEIFAKLARGFVAAERD